MPDARLAKTRRSLPEGYQFGDMGLALRAVPLGKTGIAIRFVKQYDIEADKRPCRYDLYGPFDLAANWNDTKRGEH